MKIRSFLLMLLSLLALHSTARADGCTGCGLRNQSDDQNCELGNTPLTRCVNFGEYLRHDKELNIAYRRLTIQLDRHSLMLLKKTQREWIQWRDEQCEDVEEAASCTNGICAGVNHDACVVAVTKKRTSEIVGFSRNLQEAKESSFVFEKIKGHE